MSSTEKEVDLYVETTSEADLMKLRVEREDLLARYLPDSRVVQDINKRIAQLEAFLEVRARRGPAASSAPTPTWQALEADEAVQTANISAMQGQGGELKRQKEDAGRRLEALGGAGARLSPPQARSRRS